MGQPVPLRHYRAVISEVHLGWFALECYLILLKSSSRLIHEVHKLGDQPKSLSQPNLSICMNVLPLPEVEVGEDALLAVDDGREEHDLHDDARSLGCNSIDI